MIQKVVSTHFARLQGKIDQPHILSLQLQYLRPVSPGRGLITIRDTKLGPGISTVHATVTQDSKDKVLGYVTYDSYRLSSSMHMRVEILIRNIGVPR